MTLNSPYELKRRGWIGRAYDLSRAGTHTGELRRRAVFRPRYEFDCGPHKWVARHLDNVKRPSELIDRDSKAPVALVHTNGVLEVMVPAWRPHVHLTWGSTGHERAFVDPQGQGWITFGTQDVIKKVRIEAHGPATVWPADDPETGFLVTVAFGLAMIISQIDEATQAAGSNY